MNFTIDVNGNVTNVKGDNFVGHKTVPDCCNRCRVCPALFFWHKENRSEQLAFYFDVQDEHNFNT